MTYRKTRTLRQLVRLISEDIAISIEDIELFESTVNDISTKLDSLASIIETVGDTEMSEDAIGPDGWLTKIRNILDLNTPASDAAKSLGDIKSHVG